MHPDRERALYRSLSPPGEDSDHYLHRNKLPHKAGDRPIELFPKQTWYDPPDGNRHAYQQKPHYEPERIHGERRLGRRSPPAAEMNRISSPYQHTTERVSIISSRHNSDSARPDDFSFKNAAAWKRREQSPPLTRRHPSSPYSARSPENTSPVRPRTGPRSPQALKHGSLKHPVRNLAWINPALPQRAAPSMLPNATREATSKSAATSWSKFSPVDPSVKSRPHIHIAAGNIFASPAAYQIIKGHVKPFNPVDTWVDDNGYYIVFPRTNSGLRDMARCEKAHRNTKLFKKHLLNMQLYPDGQAPGGETLETDIVSADEVSRKNSCSKKHHVQELSSNDTFVAKVSEEVATNGPSSSPQPSAGLQELRKLFPPRSTTPLERESALVSQDSVKPHGASKLQKDDASSIISGTTSSSRTKMGSQACHKCPSIGGQLFNCTTCKRRYHRQCLPLSITPDDIDERWQCERCVRKGIPKRSHEHQVSATCEGEQASACSLQARPELVNAEEAATPVNMATATKTNITHELQHNPASQSQQTAIEPPSTILPLDTAAASRPRSATQIDDYPAAELATTPVERSSEPQHLDTAPPTGNAVLQGPMEDIVDTPEVEAADDLVEKSFSVGAHKPSTNVETSAKKGLIIKRVKKTADPKLRDEGHAVPAESLPSISRRDERVVDMGGQLPFAMQGPVTENLETADKRETLPNVNRAREQHTEGGSTPKTSQRTGVGHIAEKESTSNVDDQAPSIPISGIGSNVPVNHSVASCASPADSVLEERTLPRPSIAKAKRNPIAPVPCSICRRTKVPRHPSGRSVCTKCKRADVSQASKASIAPREAKAPPESPEMDVDPPSTDRLDEGSTGERQQAEAARAHVDASSNHPATLAQQALAADAEEIDNPTEQLPQRGEPVALRTTSEAPSISQKRKFEPASRSRENEDAFDLGYSTQRPKNTYWKLISMALCAAPEHRMQPAAVASWVAKNVPGYNLKEGSWAGSLKASLIHNNNGELGKQICSVVNVRGSEGTIEKWYELLPGLEFRLMQWDSVLQKPFMQASPVSPGVIQSQAEGQLIVSEEVTEPWRSRDVVAKKRCVQLAKSTGSLSQSQSFDDSTASTQEVMEKPCATIDEESSEDEPLARAPRRQQHVKRPNTAPAVRDSQGCNGQADGDPMEIDEVSTLLNAAAQSPAKSSDEGTEAFEDIGDDGSLAIMPEEEDDQNELRELIRQEESEAAYTEKSLFETWPEYDPGVQFDAAAKIAEIARRPRKKQLFGTPAFYSPLGEQPFLRVDKRPASTIQKSPVKLVAKSRAREAQDKTDATTVRTFDTLDDFFGLNDVDVVPFIDDGQICFKHKNGKRGVFKTGI